MVTKYFLYLNKRSSIKDVRSQEERGLTSAGIFRTRDEGFFRCGHPHFFAQKTSDFSKFMVCQNGQGGKGLLSQCKHFVDKGEGVNFSRFCADVLPTSSQNNFPFCFNLLLADTTNNRRDSNKTRIANASMLNLEEAMNTLFKICYNLGFQ